MKAKVDLATLTGAQYEAEVERRARAAAKFRKRRIEKRDEVLASERKYRAAHREELNAASRIYAAAHREIGRISKAKRRARDPEAVRAEEQAKWDNNRERLLENTRTRAERNPAAAHGWGRPFFARLKDQGLWTTYCSWRNVRARVKNDPDSPSYFNYAGRGIKMADRWRESFQLFLQDMGRRPEGTSLDRIDVKGNYEPGNCRWADASTQTLNRRPRSEWTPIEELSQKNRARVLAKRAVASGKLIRTPCACGEIKVQGHHHNGYEPGHELDVVWLCTKCHAKETIAENKLKRAARRAAQADMSEGKVRQSGP